jgi:hypothetical protein
MSRPSPDRLAQANAILSTFLPGATLAIARGTTGGPFIVLHHDGKPHTVVLNNAGSGLASLGGPNARLHFGGTAHDAIATLVRFVYGRTRRPLAWWTWKGFKPGTIEAIRATSYIDPDDPTRTACVLCGDTGDHVQADWWADVRGRKVGPCCAFGRCRDRADSGINTPAEGGTDGE